MGFIDGVDVAVVMVVMVVMVGPADKVTVIQQAATSLRQRGTSCHES